jgi:hypothetical protein
MNASNVYLRWFDTVLEKFYYPALADLLHIVIRLEALGLQPDYFDQIQLLANWGPLPEVPVISWR